MMYQWIELKTVLVVHDMQIREHGTAPGINDLERIESAIDRPQKRQQADSRGVVAIAAEYAFGLIKNHGFVDGNKRTAYIIARLFLRLHGWDFTATPVERVLCFAALGNGEYSFEAFLHWLKNNCIKKY